MGGNKIKTIQAREILDSRGNPTIEVRVGLKNGVAGVASVPSGASTGSHEAFELRDGNKKRYAGLGVLKAVKNVNEQIARVLMGTSVIEQQKIDQKMIELDGTENKRKLGANAILGVSLACARVGAISSRMPLYQYIHLVYSLSASFSSSKLQVSSLPTPMFNVFNGGKHADTNLDFQEFMLVPLKQTKFSEKVRMGSEIFHTLGKVLLANNLDTDVGNEGGYAPDIDSSVEAVEYIMEAITKAGYKPGKDVGIGIDVGAQELYNKAKKRYIFELDDCELTSDQLISLYKDWLKDYPIVSIEDGLGEDDWTNWKQMTRELLSQKNIKTFPPKADLLQGRMGLWSKPLAEKQKNKKQKRDIMLIGDDLFVTNIERVRKAIDRRIANAVLIKPNQVGTLTQAIECAKVSQGGGYKVVVSHRSGETGDDFIADLAVAIGADYFKAGSLSRGERVVKYNRIMAIEEELG